MCGCCCSNIDYDGGTVCFRTYDENDIYSFSELDGVKLFRTYYYSFRYDEILCKNEHGMYWRIQFLKSRVHCHANYSKTHCILTDKNGKILIYDIENLKNKLKEAYHQNVRNKLKDNLS